MTPHDQTPPPDAAPEQALEATAEEAARRAEHEREQERLEAARREAVMRETALGLDLCLRIGEVLLSSGAGAADVSATMQSVAASLGIRNVDVDVTFTSLSMTAQEELGDPPVVGNRQVSRRTIDYDQLTSVDHLVRALLREEVDLRQARTEMGRITSTGRSRPRWAVTIAWAVMCAGVGLQLGGKPLVIALAAVSAVLIDRIQHRMAKRRLPSFYQQVAGGGVATLLALGVAATPLQINVSQVVTANIIMLLAGVGFVGALQDALTGYYVTASARLMEAFLATAGIIAGVSGGLSLGGAVGLPTPVLEPGTYNLQTVGMLVLGSALAAAGFAYASYAPLRVLPAVAGVAGAAIVISRTLAEVDLARAWSTAFAATAVGLVAYHLAARYRVPPLVVVVSGVVPMLPGLSIYRSLTLLSEGGSAISEGLLAMVAAISVAISIASGVILGEYLAQPLAREASKLEHRLSGPRLVGPLKVPRPKRRKRGSTTTGSLRTVTPEQEASDRRRRQRQRPSSSPS
ncbi:threonine/serine ThrE exporter family protein [Nocardioides bruguierae]|uniref:Threonine/serine exporter family protein n=1 Tax=Nocardioides bruguierae TaxID=2945102 RepID=A0A9X2D6B0_9ACTN|nr:threonine/serine exporter family protein [Nocardioides bruguierae]MCM0620111.1 threonine/serine exporter family protein [Nocardioides bruguierae]